MLIAIDGSTSVSMEDVSSDSSEVSIGSDTRSSSLSLQYSASPFEDTTLGESEEDHETGRVEPYMYEPEDSEEESSMADSGGADEESDETRTPHQY